MKYSLLSKAFDEHANTIRLHTQTQIQRYVGNTNTPRHPAKLHTNPPCIAIHCVYLEESRLDKKKKTEESALAGTVCEVVSSHVRKLLYLCVPTLAFEMAEVWAATITLRLVKGTTVYSSVIGE